MLRTRRWQIRSIPSPLLSFADNRSSCLCSETALPHPGPPRICPSNKSTANPPFSRNSSGSAWTHVLRFCSPAVTVKDHFIIPRVPVHHFPALPRRQTCAETQALPPAAARTATYSIPANKKPTLSCLCCLDAFLLTQHASDRCHCMKSTVPGAP